MRASTTLVALSGLLLASAQETGKLGDAQVVSNNPQGASYGAVLPENKYGVSGSVVAMSNPSGEGVDFAVSISGLPAAGGPFMYHIHVEPVPASGNCTSTLAHHDPYERGEATDCNAAKPETCQVGDLSGKHGKIATSNFSASYTDKYASLVPGLGSFFGNRSIVVHYANKTRITCANFTLLDTSKTPGSMPSGMPMSNHSSMAPNKTATASSAAIVTGTSATGTPISPSRSAPVQANMAGAIGLSSVALLGAIAALLL